MSNDNLEYIYNNLKKIKTNSEVMKEMVSIIDKENSIIYDIDFLISNINFWTHILFENPNEESEKVKKAYDIIYDLYGRIKENFQPFAEYCKNQIMQSSEKSEKEKEEMKYIFKMFYGEDRIN